MSDMRTKCAQGWLALAVLSAGVWAEPAWALPTFEGREISAMTRQSIDLIDFHLTFLQAQSTAVHPLGYFGTNTRWAPGRFRLNDGQELGGNLARWQFNVGLGFGRQDSFAFFAGANYDWVFPSNGGLSNIGNFQPPLQGQVYGFIGAAILDVQITWGKLYQLGGGGGLNQDPWGSYMATDREDPFSYRSGTPAAIEQSDSSSEFSVLTLYENRTGAFLAASFEQYVDNRYEQHLRLNELRLNVQPLQGLPDEVFETYGIPSVGFRRLDGLRKLTEAPDAPQRPGTPSLPSPSLPTAEPPPAPDYEFETGADDVLAGGFRWRVAGRVAPSFALARYEAGYVEEFPLADRNTLRVGARTTGYRNRGEFEVGGEAYALFGYWPRVASMPVPMQAGLSYSYNTPDASTFLPIANAHVFGVQMVIGYPETTRPLVPLVRTIEERKRAMGGGGE